MDHHVHVAITEGLLYVHQLSVTIGQAVRDLELITKALAPEDMRNHIEFIPL